MSVAHETLPLSIGELQRTRVPLERATMLPGRRSPIRACSSGSSSTSSSAAGSAPATSTRSASAATTSWSSSAARASSSSPTTTASRAPSSTPAATAARASSTSPRAGCRAPAVPLPRLDLRLRRRAAERAVHRRASRTSTPRATACAPCALRRRRGARAARPVRRRRRRPRSTSATWRPLLARYRLGEPAPRRADRLRRRRQLEGDRRELQRVPALPRRAPRAQPALALPVRRDDRPAPARGAAAR